MGSSALLRLFVAAYPPPALAQRAVDAACALGLAGLKPSPPSQVHLTLHFVGEVPAREEAAVRESVERAAAGIGALKLLPRRLVTLPERGPARLVAMTTDAPAALLELHRRLVARLARRPSRDAGRAFVPHLTLARFPGVGAPGIRVDHPLEWEEFLVERVQLMASVLRAQGAEHRQLHSVALGPGHRHADA